MIGFIGLISFIDLFLCTSYIISVCNYLVRLCRQVMNRIYLGQFAVHLA